MIKLLLTSTGLANDNITQKFLELSNKPVKQIKIIIVPTASRSPEEIYYVQESKRELLEIGIQEHNIKTLNLDHIIEYDEVKDYHVIYVCGGSMCIASSGRS